MKKEKEIKKASDEISQMLIDVGDVKLRKEEKNFNVIAFFSYLQALSWVLEDKDNVGRFFEKYEKGEDKEK